MLWIVLIACQSTPEPTVVPPDEETTTTEVISQAQVARLSHVQWDLTTRDLLFLPDDVEKFTDGFVDSAGTAWFENNRGQLAVEPTLWLQYQAASEQLSALVANDPQILAKVAPERTREAFIQGFGGRAFRRPLTADELANYEALFDKGPGIFDTGDDFADGAHAVIAAMLQSPFFLYQGLGPEGPDSGPTLDDYELASKLSYGLWNTMPDDELFLAAAKGLSGPALQSQVRRMLDDPRSADMIADIHRQWMHLDSYQHIYRTKDERYDDYEKSAPHFMTMEAYTFVDRIVFSGGTIEEMFTSRETVVEAKLADIYGLSGFEEETTLGPTTLPEGERSGLLTLSGFLAWQADYTTPDLINRGAYVSHDVLCAEIPPPPPGIPPLPVDETGLSLRERIEAHTGTCGASCHNEYINPVGFAFGQYDEYGRFEPVIEGKPVDASSSFNLDAGKVSFDGAVELMGYFAKSPQVHRCYISHLLSYAEGRSVNSLDDDRLDQLTVRSLSGDSILDIIEAIVLDDAFITRPAVE